MLYVQQTLMVKARTEIYNVTNAFYLNENSMANGW
jgi:hypothetical protein